MILLLCLICLTVANTVATPGTVLSLSGTARNIGMTVISVKSAAELTTALKNAKAGDTISLAAGEYGAVVISGKNYASGVTIKSDSSTKAHLDSLNVSNSSNLTFDGLDVGGSSNVKSASFKAVISGSTNITFDDMNIHGTMDGNAQNDSSGVRVLNSTNVAVKNSEFQQLLRGITFNQSSNIEFSGNSVHDIRMDGSAFAQVSNVLIDSNKFTNFNRMAEDHSDAIQFWTTGTTVASTDIKIVNNQILQGTGTAMQGIFMKDETTTLAYTNVTIENNLIYESGYANGLTIDHGQDLVVSGNTVVSSSNIGGSTKIRMENTSNLKLVNNITDDFAFFDKNANVTNTNNVLLARTPGKSSLLADLGANASASALKLVTSGIGYQPAGKGDAIQLKASSTTPISSTAPTIIPTQSTSTSIADSAGAVSDTTSATVSSTTASVVSSMTTQTTAAPVITTTTPVVQQVTPVAPVVQQPTPSTAVAATTTVTPTPISTPAPTASVVTASTPTTTVSSSTPAFTPPTLSDALVTPSGAAAVKPATTSPVASGAMSALFSTQLKSFLNQLAVRH